VAGLARGAGARGRSTPRGAASARARAGALAALLALACDRAPPPEPALDLEPVALEPVALDATPPNPPRAARPAAAPRPQPALDALLTRIGGRHVALERPCVEPGPGDTCRRRALDATFRALDTLIDRDPNLRLDADAARAPAGPHKVRFLLLGDSHIAADYIAKTSRAALQATFGDGGRGYVHGDQLADYGGRRKERRGFGRERMVDVGEVEKRFGASGFVIEAQRAKASADFVVDGDAVAALYAERGRGDVALSADGRVLARTSLTASVADTLRFAAGLPRGATKLSVIAETAGLRYYGLSWERGPGLLLDAIGPVGADAHAYVRTEPTSFRTHVAALSPTLVMLMLGGNDALRVRKGEDDFAGVERDLVALVRRLREGAPGADCLLWGPMDAGDRAGGKIVPKTLIPETRDLLRRIARQEGCAFWDMLAYMGEQGAVVRWSQAKIMNADLIHPRAKAGELLGYGFARAFLEAYAAGDDPGPR
jgi:hypothetical protein